MTHRAVRFTTPLTAELKAVNTPALQEHQVLIKVYAAALNPVDEQLHHYLLNYYYSHEKGLGRDFSGVIEATRDGAWRVGEEVCGLLLAPYGQGTLSEKIIVDTSQHPCLVKKPPNVSHVEAAGIPLVSLTAYSCLQYLPSEKSTGRCLVLGGSSACGIWAVQLLKQAHRHVTATCSDRNTDFVRSLGADDTIDYTKQDVKAEALQRGPFELIIDTVGGTELLADLPRLLPRKNAYVTIVGNKHDRATLGGPATYMTTPMQWLQYYWGKYVGPRWEVIILQQNKVWLQDALDQRAKGSIKTFVDSTFSLDQWKEAFDKLNTGRARGKVVIKIV